jgi:hypothetical protein
VQWRGGDDISDDVDGGGSAVGLPLASVAHGISTSRVCGESCITAIAGLRAPAAPPYLYSAA